MFFLPLYPKNKFQMFLRQPTYGCYSSVFSSDFEQLLGHSVL